MPDAEDFALMAQEGYEVVISLAEHSDSSVLQDEDTLVSSAGMRYIHVPIGFEAPALDDYALLSDLLRALYPRKVWLHCAKNYRVSSIMCVYHVVELGKTQAQAEEILHLIWQPNEVWRRYIDDLLERYAYQYI